MASACVTNSVDFPPPYGWLTSPRISFSDSNNTNNLSPDTASDPSNNAPDFEFHLHDHPVAMLPADELFSDGKLVPLHLTATVRPPTTSAPPPEPSISLSPKAPRCSSRWRELLGLRKHKSNSNSETTSSGKSIRQLLLRNTKSAPESSSLHLPLLKDSDSAVSSSRLSSSSSGHDFDDLPRLSLDADTVKPKLVVVRTAKPRNLYPKPLIDHPSAPPATTILRSGVSADSPRMSSSGKIVFQSLERSSSSPSSFNGGPRHKHRGMERSYSSNVRITPVLNVPVCSLRGSSKSGVFGLFSSQSVKKEGNTGAGKPSGNRSCRVRREG